MKKQVDTKSTCFKFMTANLYVLKHVQARQQLLEGFTFNKFKESTTTGRYNQFCLQLHIYQSQLKCHHHLQ
jgi:hypothetical protein